VYPSVSISLEKAIEIRRSHETNLASLKKLTKDEDPIINAITPVQLVPPARPTKPSILK
jgi:hypothetical protein